MEKSLIDALLRVVQQPAPVRLRPGKTLAAFARDYNLGRARGAQLEFSAADQQQIRGLLQARAGIDADRVTPQSWLGLSRAESLGLGADEKLSRAPVRRDRVAVKPLPGRPLHLDGEALRLPPRCHIELDGRRCAGLIGPGHERVLLIENWEAFDALDALRLDLSAAGADALVVWRGGGEGCRSDHALALLAALGRPVLAFVDYDPAGLLIALTLPHLAGVLAPPGAELAERLRGGLRERYLEQLPQCAATLDAAVQPDVARLWRLIRSAGRALPQEAFIEPEHTAQAGTAQASLPRLPASSDG